MRTDFSSCWDWDWKHCDWVCKVNCHLFSFLIFNHGNFISTRLVSTKEFLIPLETLFLIFSSILSNKVNNIMRLQNLYQEYCNNMSRMSIKTFMIFLSLEYVDEISSLHWDTCDIMDFILSFFLMIWWIGNFEILLVSLIIYTHEAKLWKTMFVTNAI